MNLFKKSTILFFLLCSFTLCAQELIDKRDIETGYPIFTNGYIDQPYVAVLPNGSWLCVFTTGAGAESKPGQHIVATVSTNEGETWSIPVDIEPNTGPTASWATPYLTHFGRVYVFYDYNVDNINTLNGKLIWHNSEMGWYCYKYSDDYGKTWSKRYRLPMPKAPVDFKNDFKGEVQLFWGIDKPKEHNGKMLFAFTRLGKYVQADGEGWFYSSDNIATERDADKLNWELLPDGEYGLRNSGYGSIQEEHNTVPLNNGDLYCMYRTTLGFPVHSYSRDGGKTWMLPVAATYTPDGRDIFKNPRACPRVFKVSNGKYVFWYHNNGQKGYQGRNPVWLSGGIEKNGKIHWSQPEILFYSRDTTIQGMSYPDFIEQDGKYWFTETQKTIARVHPVDNALLEGMWNQTEAKSLIKKGLTINKSDIGVKQAVNIPRFPTLGKSGLTVDLWLQLNDTKAGQVVLDTRDGAGRGILFSTRANEVLNLQLSDGDIVQNWDTDSGLLTKGKPHHVVFIVDGLANIISVVVDGKLCDGGMYREYGWGRLSDQLRDINGSEKMQVATSLDGSVKNLRIYDRYLTTSEVISNYNYDKRKLGSN